jgi:hypothetical protein
VLRNPPSREALLGHLKLGHRKQQSWFEEAGTSQPELDAAHAWDHAARHLDHPPLDLRLAEPEVDGQASA